MWTTNNIPNLIGKTALVTGANSGIGFEIANALYQKGALVILTGRDITKVENAAIKIKNTIGTGTIETALVNLSSLKELKQFSEFFASHHNHLDYLFNNAGVMTPPKGKTEEGYELQFGVNFLGHFALTVHLYPLLKSTPNSRVINISSGAYKYAESIDYSNLKSEKSYDANREYAISKLANLQFTLTLQRKISSSGDTIISTAAHPGVTETSLSRHMDTEAYNSALEKFKGLMPASQGALPALFAAFDPGVKGGDYFGPDGEDELKGYPAPAILTETAINIQDGERLWEYAQQATGLVFP